MDKNNTSKQVEKKILNELERIGNKVDEIESRLSYLEKQKEISPPAKKTIFHEVEVERKENILHELYKNKPAIKDTKTIIEGEEKAEKEILDKSTEEKIGIKWLSWIGIISIFFAMIFFVKYSFEHGILGPMGKVIMGMVVGLVLLLIGDVVDKRKHGYFARSVTGGGFAVLYLTIYAMHHFYHLIPDEFFPIILDSILLGAVVICGVIFSFKYNSMIIAFEAFFLGYIIPFTGAIDIHTLVYLLVLTTGAVILSKKEGWLLPGIGGINLMYLTALLFPVSQNNYVINSVFLVLYIGIIVIMMSQVKDLKIRAGIGIISIFWTYLIQIKFTPDINLFPTTALFLVIYFIIFTALSFSFSMRNNRINKNSIRDNELLAIDIIFVSINVLFFYGIMLWRLNEFYPSYCGLFTLAMAGAYMLPGYLAANRKIKNLLTINLVLCLIFMTITAPIQVDDEYVTLVWIIEALILLVLGIHINNKFLRIFSNIIAGMLIVKILFIDSWQLEGLTRLAVFLAGILMFYAGAIMYHKKTRMLEKYELPIELIYIICGTVITTVMLAVELKYEFIAAKGWISAAWSVQAILLLLIGFYYKYKALRILGLILFVVTIVKVFLFDIAGLPTVYKIISLMVLGAILLAAAYVYSKYNERI